VGDRGYDAIIKLLTDYEGVNIQSTDEDGSTPLLWAACQGHEAAVSLLIGKGTDLNIGDKNDMTPLDWVKYRGYEAVEQLLESAAEDLEFQKKIATGKPDGSEIRAIAQSGTNRKDSYPLTLHPKPKAYLFDDQTTEFSRRT
jgi:ankyrin repeat protein